MPCRRSRVRVSFPAQHTPRRIRYPWSLISPAQIVSLPLSKVFTASAFLGAIILLAWVPVSCTYQDASKIPAQLPPGPSQESWNVTTVISQADSGTDTSRTRLIIAADYVEWVEEEDNFFQLLQGIDNKVEVEIYDSSGTLSAMLEAYRVSYYESETRFVAEGEVVVQTSDGRMLVSEWIEWKEDDRLLRTDRFVQITTPDEVVSGTGLEASEDLSSYQIGEFRAEVVLDS